VKLVDFSGHADLDLLRQEMGGAPLLNIFRDAVVPKRPPAAQVQAPIREPKIAPPVPPRPVFPPPPIKPPVRVLTGSSPEFKPSPKSSTTSGVFEIDFGDMQIGSGGELRYQGQKAIFYIRDVSSYQGNYSLPKYHIADCITRQGMRTKNLNERFIANTRGDGVFPIRLDGRTRNEQLSVCQHCLEQLQWKGFTRTLSTETRKRRVLDFSLQEYLRS
jgi:hypothetical protein